MPARKKRIPKHIETLREREAKEIAEIVEMEYRMGHPVLVSFKVPQSQMAELRTIATERGIMLSPIIGEIVETYLNLRKLKKLNDDKPYG